jgi:cell division control protein 6
MQDVRDIVESELNRKSLFLDKSKLYPEYLPKHLPHREKQLKVLASLFRTVLQFPGTASIRTVIVGPIGTGKTATARIFGKVFSETARRRGIKMRYVHINCNKIHGASTILSEAIKQLGFGIPTRGLSAKEMLAGILHMMNRENMYAVIALDEFDYFLRSAREDDKYFIVRIYDIFQEEVKRLNFIYISRTTEMFSYLDQATESYLIKNIVYFTPYTSGELFDILRSRAEEAFLPGVVNNDVLKFIADIVGVDKGGPGNARMAIEILMRAGELADDELREGKSDRVTVDHVRKVSSYVDQSVLILNDILPNLNLHEMLVLKSIATALSIEGEDYVPIGTVEEFYRELCGELGVRSRGHTKVYEYVMNMKNMGIIMTRTSLKGKKGRSTYISFGMAPLEALIKRLDELIKIKRLEEWA